MTRPPDTARRGWDSRTGWDALGEVLPVAVLVLDASDRLLWWNSAAAELLGWPSGEVREGPGLDAVAAVVAPDEVEAARAQLADVRRGRPWRGTLSTRSRTLLVRSRAADDDGTVVCSLTSPEGDRAELLAREQRAHEELAQVRDRLAFVVDAGERLDSSLDVNVTLETVVDLVVPRLARLATVDLWDGQHLETVQARAADAARPKLADEVQGLSGRQAADHPGLRAVRSGRTISIDRLDLATIASMYTDAEDRRVAAEAFAGQYYCCVPLLTRGRTLGVLGLSGPPFAGSARSAGSAGSAWEADLPVVEQLARRAAQAIVNARLFGAERRLASNLARSERREREAARTLQHSLLPPRTKPPDGLDLASRYFPCSDEADVGGDWYDVVPIGPDRTALVVGDVMGRGLRAASLMGQARTAVRAYAREDLPPGRILELADLLVNDVGETAIVTCVYAVFDAARRSLTYASAGHMPLVLVQPDGTARRLNDDGGIPLGVASCAAPAHTLEVPPGTMVAFYTDGLVEHRERDVDVGIDQLVTTLTRRSGSLESLCDGVIEDMRPGAGYDDDVALLLARSSK